MQQHTFGLSALPVRPMRRAWLLVAAAFILAALLPTRGDAANQDGRSETQNSKLTIQDLPGSPRVSTASDGVLSRIDEEVMRQARDVGADGTVPVLIVSQGALADTAGLTHVARGRPDAAGLTFTTANANPGTLVKVATSSNVVSLLPDTAPAIDPLPEPQYARPTSGRPYARTPLRGDANVAMTPSKAAASTQNPLAGQKSAPLAAAQGSDSPDSWHTLDVHHVRDAWSQGYRGTGVNVAVIDSGIDFGHPDLQNTFARVTDPSSPYYGWPYVVDPYSLELLSLGVVHDIPEAITGYGSWFVDTSTTVRGSQAYFTTVTATSSEMTRTTHLYTLPNTSRSGTYHMGIHPDEHLAFDIYAEYPAVLVADTVTPGVYDTVYVDLNDNHDFRDDTPMRRGSEVATRDVNGDGVADLSAGMLYFIADGRRPIPASDWLYGLLPPSNGDLVALFGSFDYAEDHGTFCASSVVAQGRIDGQTPLRPPYKPAGVGGMVQGMAPDAKIVGIGNIYRSGAAIYNGMLIAALGLDGRPNTGDEPQVASMSFGFSGGWNNGWDFVSRYLLYLSQYNPSIAWLASTGNGGPGYGTITPPATSPAAIAVGAATQYGETTTFEPISSVDRITSGDVQPWSNRGPSHLGEAKPDVVAVGAWGTGDVPINMSPRNGTIAYDVWGGTSMSTPIGAGITALVYQAYKARTDHWPDAETVRTLLKSSAADLNYSPFLQGAGMLDASRAVQMAARRGGVAVSPSSWVPGSPAPGFAGTLAPGDIATKTFSLENRGTTPVTGRIRTEQLVETSSFEWSVPVSNSLESRANFSRPDYLWDMSSHVPSGTDLVRVTAVVSYTDFSLSDPKSQFLGSQSSWRLLAYDWHDDNADSTAWRDLNHNGVVNDNELESGELNRFTYGYNLNDSIEIETQRPLERSHNGYLVGLQHQLATNYILTSTIHLKLTTYRKQPWSMLDAPAADFTIPAGGTITVGADAAVPLGTASGAYEGQFVVETGSGANLSSVRVPVAVNVQANSLQSTLGGQNRPAALTPYDNGRVTGQQNWSWRPESGEWRHFYLDNPTPIQPYTFLWAGATWRNFPTDLDLVVGGPDPGDWFSQHFPALFGNYSMGGIAGSAWTNLGGGQWQWRTATDTTEEWVSGRPGATGLHEAIVHNVFYSGLQQSEPFTATVGTVQLSQDYVDIVSNKPYGSAALTMTTGMELPGLRAQAFGLSQKRTWPHNEILPLHTWFSETNVSNVGTIEFSTDAPDGTNVDLYVDHFENGRYIWVGASTGPSGQEYVRIEPALPGNYRIRVDAARDVPTPAYFDMSIKAIQGTDLTVAPSVISNTVPAGTTITYTVSYDHPGLTDGVWEGRLFLGPLKAPALTSFPVTVYHGNITPTPSPTPRVCHIRFADVPASLWAYPYIEDLYCRGIVSGYLDQTFRPNAPASRVQFIKMAVLGMGWPLIHPETPTFTDVPELSWGYEFVETANNHGIVNGYSDGTFRPSNPITRGQLTKMLVLAKGWPLNDPAQPTFSDMPRGAAFYPFIETAVEHGLISGYSDGTVRPNAGATRAQLSKMLYQAMRAP